MRRTGTSTSTRTGVRKRNWVKQKAWNRCVEGSECAASDLCNAINKSRCLVLLFEHQSICLKCLKTEWCPQRMDVSMRIQTVFMASKEQRKTTTRKLRVPSASASIAQCSSAPIPYFVQSNSMKESTWNQSFLIIHFCCVCPSACVIRSLFSTQELHILAEPWNCK